MGKTRVRLKDIARTTGFSANTVSLALRGSPRLPEKTRALILEEAERLNYLPNNVARSLVSRATRTIGLVLTDIMNPTITLAARSIEKHLTDAGYAVMFAASHMHLANEKVALDLFQSYQVDGIVVYPTNHKKLDHIHKVRQSGYPVLVLANLPVDGLDVVAVDDRKGAYKAISHIISRGHRRIAMLDGGHMLRNEEKQDGARRAIADAGLRKSTLHLIDPKGHSATRGYKAMQKAMTLKQRPTALFATTDSLAIGAVRWCLENGLNVPNDLAIVGYDNTEAAEFCSVPLTSVNYAADEVSRRAVERIISIVQDSSGVDGNTVSLVEPELVVRQSC